MSLTVADQKVLTDGMYLTNHTGYKLVLAETLPLAPYSLAKSQKHRVASKYTRETT